MSNKNKKEEYILDGTEFTTLKEFAAYFSKKVFPNDEWRGGLDAFNDMLRGGYGTPECGFILRWINSDVSRKNLGIEETIKWYEERGMNAHPTNREGMKAKAKELKTQPGETLFDWIVEIIRHHGEGGIESEDNVELILE